METQLNILTKEEARKYLDESPGDKFLIIVFNKRKGISTNGKSINKGKCKKMVRKADMIVLTDIPPVLKLDLHSKRLFYIVKSIFISPYK